MVRRYPDPPTGSLISFETGDAVTYGLFNAQQRGTLIVNAGEKVYAGEVVGYTPTGEDITVNVCKTKHLTNTRASGSDDALRLVPVSSSAWRAAWNSWPPTSCWKSPREPAHPQAHPDHDSAHEGRQQEE